MTYAKPIPIPSHETRPYWEGIRQHKLLMPRCEDCGHRWFPPTTRCQRCRSARIAWAEMSGRGKVHTFVNFHRAYHKGFAAERPYCVAIVELEEGPRMMSNIIGIAPDQVRCDMPVKVVFEDIAEDAALPKFVPA